MARKLPPVVPGRAIGFDRQAQRVRPVRATQRLRTDHAAFGARVVSALPPRLQTVVDPGLTQDQGLRDHSDRLGALAKLIGRAVGHSDSGWLDRLSEAAVLHDIGKILVDREILGKAVGFTEADRTHIRQHVVLGHRLLLDAAPDQLALAASVARHHHEAHDGTGYPDGLSGDAIPKEARIIGLCDVYDALRSPRVYKPGMSHAAVMSILLNGDGRTRPKQFDPHLLSVFERHSPDIAALYDAFGLSGGV